MDDLAFIKTRIATFAGYEHEPTRHLADQQVRAFVGETLGMLRERLEGTFDGELSARLERILLRCEFSDPKFIHGLQRRNLSEADVAALYAADRELMSAAIQIARVSLERSADLSRELDGLERLFDRRYSVTSP